jgi:cytochrome b6-f complex iron-sulfur subunit
MYLNRRQFLILTAGLAAGGCQSVSSGSPSTTSASKTINAGPVSDYAADGVYTRYREKGFFIVRHGDKLFAISSFCTHRKCKLTPEADRSFYCQCHGSTFTPEGHVTKGPARRDLPVFSTSTDEKGQLLVQLP